MSSVAASPDLKPDIQPPDRLGLTLALAVIVHTMVVLGVSFAPEPDAPSRFDSLEVILVSERSENTPEDARVLAQASLEGGGNAESETPPAAPVKAPLPAETASIAASPAAPAPAVPSPSPLEPEPAPAATPSPAAPAAAEAAQEPLLATLAQRAELAQPDQLEQAPRPATPETSETAPETPPREAVNTPVLPTAAQLLTRSFALASLNAELQQRLDSRAQRPRRKYISANTREYRFAAYMEAWRAKVERIGNINYPNEAREKSLSGNLLLDVAINPDGSVREITVRRSSGHKVLDDAAIRIVELAAPYAAFPDNIREEVDVLHITRTWKFLNNRQFSSR